MTEKPSVSPENSEQDHRTLLKDLLGIDFSKYLDVYISDPISHLRHVDKERFTSRVNLFLRDELAQISHLLTESKPDDMAYGLGFSAWVNVYIGLLDNTIKLQFLDEHNFLQDPKYQDSLKNLPDEIKDKIRAIPGLIKSYTDGYNAAS